MQNIVNQLEELLDRLKVVTGKLYFELDNLRACECNHQYAQERLLNKRAEILCSTDPKELGPNETVREAQFRLRLKEEYLRCADTNEVLREARNDVEKARIALQFIRDELRMWELLGKVSGEELEGFCEIQCRR